MREGVLDLVARNSPHPRADITLLRVRVHLPDSPLEAVKMRIDFEPRGYFPNSLTLTYPSYASFKDAMWELYLGG